MRRFQRKANLISLVQKHISLEKLNCAETLFPALNVLEYCRRRIHLMSFIM